MAEQVPITQQIADYVLAAINEIGTYRGDQTTLVAAEEDAEGNTLADGDVVLREDSGDSEDESGDESAGWRTWSTKFEAYFFVIQKSDEGWSAKRRLRLIKADIVKKLMEGDSQMGGLADEIYVTSFAWGDGRTGEPDGMTLYFTVQHTERRTDPYSGRTA